MSSSIVSRAVLLMGVFLFTGCGSSQQGASLPQNAEELAVYVQRFYALAQENGRTNLPQVAYAWETSASLEAAGSCYPDQSLITINFDQWLTFDEARREAVVFHELGHCVLGRDHLDGWTYLESSGGYDVATPISVMNSWLISAYSMREFRDFYVNELFHPAP